eukprot:7676958-Pyramimonas_sp.AAC.1
MKKEMNALRRHVDAVMYSYSSSGAIAPSSRYSGRGADSATVFIGGLSGFHNTGDAEHWIIDQFWTSYIPAPLETHVKGEGFQGQTRCSICNSWGSTGCHQQDEGHR